MVLEFMHAEVFNLQLVVRLIKNGIIFGADMTSLVHIDNTKKDILIFGKGPTDGLIDTTLTAGKEYAINFTEEQKKFYLSLHYNGANSYLFGNSYEIYKFKLNPLCLGNVSRDL